MAWYKDMQTFPHVVVIMHANDSQMPMAVVQLVDGDVARTVTQWHRFTDLGFDIATINLFMGQMNSFVSSEGDTYRVYTYGLNQLIESKPLPKVENSDG